MTSMQQRFSAAIDEKGSRLRSELDELKRQCAKAEGELHAKKIMSSHNT